MDDAKEEPEPDEEENCGEEGVAIQGDGVAGIVAVDKDDAEIGNQVDRQAP